MWDYLASQDVLVHSLQGPSWLAHRQCLCKHGNATSWMSQRFRHALLRILRGTPTKRADPAMPAFKWQRGKQTAIWSVRHVLLHRRIRELPPPPPPPPLPRAGKGVLSRDADWLWPHGPDETANMTIMLYAGASQACGTGTDWGDHMHCMVDTKPCRIIL